MADRPQTFIKKQIFNGDVDFKGAVDFASATVTGVLPVDDTTALVRDPGDNTKLGRIDVGNVATATTRTLTMPDSDVSLFKPFSAAVDPIATDDSASGYAVGSRGLNTVSKEVFECVVSTVGLAEWSNLSTAGAALPVNDTIALVQDPVDTTKRTRIDTGAVTTATTRTITMPDADVALADIATNNAKVTNASHTGDMAGATVLTAQSALITGKTEVSAASGDFVLISDTSDAGNIKKINATDFLGGTALPVADTTAIVEGSADATKTMRFEVDGLTTATERTVTMPDANVDLGDIATNNAKVTNATHTSEVTGGTDLAVDKIAITNKTLVTALAGDHLLVADASDSDNLKKVLASDFIGSGTDANAVHVNVANEISTITEKTTPVAADLMIIEDSEASGVKKKVQIGNLPGGGGGSGGNGSANFFIASSANESWTEDVGTWALSGADQGYWYGQVRLNSPSNDLDSISTTFTVPVTGEYKAYVLHAMFTDMGIIDVKLDAVTKLTVDLYKTAPLTYNNWSAEADFGTLTAGTEYTIAITVNGKNASSSDFNAPFQGVQLVQQSGGGGNITNWESFTPVIVSHGTVTNALGKWRRVGDSMEVEGSFQAGTATAVSSTVEIPDGEAIDGAKISGSAQNYLGKSQITTGTLEYKNMELYLFYDGSDTGVLFQSIAPSANGVMSKVNGNTFAGGGEGVFFRFTVPISGWSA